MPPRAIANQRVRRMIDERVFCYCSAWRSTSCTCWAMLFDILPMSALKPRASILRDAFGAVLGTCVEWYNRFNRGNPHMAQGMLAANYEASSPR